MEQVLEENVEISHVSNLEWLEQPTINLEEVATFHRGEKKKIRGHYHKYQIENYTTYSKSSTKIVTHQD
jgi:hypothetical protein